MSLADVSLLIVVSLFAIYGVMSALECGIAWIKAVPSTGKKHHDDLRLFTPMWEITNVFLVFGTTGLAVLFNQALQPLSRALLSTVIVGLIALLIRSCLVLYLFYSRSDSPRSPWKWLFVLVNLAIPLSFSAAGTYLLTGVYFWETSVGFLLMITAIFGIASIGLNFVNRKKREKAYTLDMVLWLIWAVSMGVVLPSLLVQTNSHLAGTALVLLSLVIALSVIGHGMSRTILHRPEDAWKYVTGAILLSPIFLAFANRPYIIANNLALEEAFGAEPFVRILLIATVIMLPFLVLGFYLFIKLMGQPAK